jgi:L,D-peptidoglycan transpeptidase YkuD (ErfK/YbiS/YcfS/YnhG family)
MSFDPIPGRLRRFRLALAHHHRSVGTLSVMVALTLVGTASAFALTSGHRHPGPGIPTTPMRTEVAVKPAIDPTSSTSISTPTTTTTTTTSPSTSQPAEATTTTKAPPAATVPVAARTTSPVPPPPTTCASALPARLATTSGAHQIVTVEAPGYGVTSATLTAWQLTGSCWTVVDGPWTARLGYTGLSADKHEGDGATPAGIFGFQSTMYGNAPNPGVHYDYRQLVCGDWWDEDSSSPTYNSFQEVPCTESDPPFDNGSSEALWTETQAYPSFAVIDYNPGRVPGLGSAIFLHADVGGPTDGCVSLPLGELDSVLDWLEPDEIPTIVLGTTATITSY